MRGVADSHKVSGIPLLAARLEEALGWREDEKSTSLAG
jgi:hypothetical protein